MPRILSHFLVILSVGLCIGGCDKLKALTRDELPRDQQAKSLLARGQTLYESGDYEEAARVYEQAVTFAPTDAAIQLALGKIYAKLGNDGQAILALKRAGELDDTSPEARSLLGEMLLRQGKVEQATKALREASQTEAGKTDPDVQRRFATALLRDGSADEAEKVIAALDAAKPDDPETLALYAEILIARGIEEKAVGLLDAAVAADPSSAHVRTARAKYFFSRGKVNEALREFDMAVKAAPDDMALAMTRARAYASAQRFEDAAKAMDDIVAARPNDVNAQASLAEVKLQAGDIRGAQAMAEQVLSRQGNNGRALFVRARAIELQSPEDPVRAINAYREVIDADPSQADALSHLWPLYLKRGEKPDAISTLEHLFMLGEADQKAELELAALYGETGMNPKRGMKLIDAALAREPGNERYLGIKRQLQKAMARGNFAGSGVQVMRGGR